MFTAESLEGELLQIQSTQLGFEEVPKAWQAAAAAASINITSSFSTVVQFRFWSQGRDRSAEAQEVTPNMQLENST